MSIFIGFSMIVISAFACHKIAGRRGMNALFWGVMGALFGPLAIAFVLLSKPVNG